MHPRSCDRERGCMPQVFWSVFFSGFYRGWVRLLSVVGRPQLPYPNIRVCGTAVPHSLFSRILFLPFSPHLTRVSENFTFLFTSYFSNWLHSGMNPNSRQFQRLNLDSALNPALSLLILHANPTNFSIHNNALTNTLVIYTLSFRHYCKQHTGAYSAWLLRVWTGCPAANTAQEC